MRDWNFLAKAPSQDRERSRSPVKTEESPRMPVFPLPLPPSLTITAKHKELPSPGQEKETTSKPDSTSYPSHKLHQVDILEYSANLFNLTIMSIQGPGAAGMSPLLQQMLTENPAMGAAMQQAMAPGLASLPSSADLLQQAHALQLLAQLQSVLMMNTRDKVRHENNVYTLHWSQTSKKAVYLF